MSKQNEQFNAPARQSGRYADNPLMSLREEMDRVFERFLGGSFWRPGSLWDSRIGDDFGFSVSTPKIDLVEKEDEVVVTAELPGITEDEVEITLAEGSLTIRGEKKSEEQREEGETVISERHFGAFERRIALPEGIDEEKCSASFDKGVLTVHLQRQPEAVKRARRIPIGK
ncbi:MAG TPA: Hsp20/alpha crystallin family protein [Kiloniellales bacterium]|jgi:HSP20 family protein|nr:Hsp20/alpha crystallin family protein [Kiloniellales bacterium]